MHPVITEQSKNTQAISRAVELNPSWFYAKCGKDNASLVLGAQDKRLVIFWHRWDAKQDEWVYELDFWLPHQMSVVDGLLLFLKRIEDLGI